MWVTINKKVIKSRDVVFREGEVEIVNDLSDKDNGIVPNVINIPSTSNHPISAQSTIDEAAEQGE